MYLKIDGSSLSLISSFELDKTIRKIQISWVKLIFILVFIF